MARYGPTGPARALGGVAMKRGIGDDELDALMARLADGDRSVFDEVFHLLWPCTLRLCTSLSGNEADAADAAQEAMVNAGGSDAASRPGTCWNVTPPPEQSPMS